MRRLRQLPFTAKLVILISIVLFLANILVGGFLYSYAKKALKENIEARMLDISNTAASLINGDVYKTIEAEDAGTLEYQKIYDTLRSFQQSVELEYVYGVRDMGDGRFVFTIDPEPVDPGEFGQEIVCTEALLAASRGVASADKEPYTDSWGEFYSAYSPIFDSNGSVAGIVAVDFSTTWYDEQLRKITVIVIIGSVVSMAVGAIIVFLLTGRIRKRFKGLIDDVGVMAKDLKKLINEAKGNTVEDENADSELDSERSDYIDRVKVQMAFMHMEIRDYFDYVKRQAYLDGMTGALNKTAYLERIHRIDKEISGGTANFAIIVFDINGLKKVNDDHGHEAGDCVISSAARAMTKAYKHENIYRIGGDEFIAILEGDIKDEDKGFEKLDAAIAEVNEEASDCLKITVSRGKAEYTVGEDADFNAVFKRADEAMYRNKAEYYMQHGDRRRRRRDD